MLENFKVNAIACFPEDGLLGRRKIKTTVQKITKENVREVLDSTIAIHAANVAEITYLWDYYRGRQDIFDKVKLVRENINNKIMVNRANEIVTFKTAYLLNEPIQYISHGDQNGSANKVIQLNEFMRAEDKESKDKEIVDWLHICGVAERLVLTDKMANVEESGAPYYIYTLDPREAYVIYSARIGEKAMAGVILQYDEEDKPFATVYTEDRCFTVTDDYVGEQGHILGGIPLIEYVNNMARMGSFEGVIPMLNGINELESDAVDNVQDFVNGFDVFQNCKLEDGEYSQLALGGKAVMIKTVTAGMEAKVYRISSELSQIGVQSRIDDLTESYLTICGMPNRNGGSSTSDTGQAVIFRDGWSEAESRAKDSEKLFTRSERQFLRIVLNICKLKGDLDLELKDIGINFARKSLNNLQSKFQCFMEGLGSSYVHPQDMYNAFGDIFGDKTAAYRRGMKWHNEQEEHRVNELNAELERERLAAQQSSNEKSTEPDDKEPNGGEDK